ncbi:MAG: YbfB/YjiJ family MFS transporter, partial [Sulfurospirillaceae bacterium]|nr:YbfB/YjiJ family MFS transporter [Sulfurospirillaceae bacterium]
EYVADAAVRDKLKSLFAIFQFRGCDTLKALYGVDISNPYALAWLLLSAGLFGLSTWAVPSIMATLSAELFGSSHTARILGLVTLFFGVGQIIGPLIAGIVTDAAGDFGFIFGFSSASLIFASLFSWYHSKKTNSS